MNTNNNMTKLKAKGSKRTHEGVVKISDLIGRVIIAVDFGTTCSGVAYAYSADPEEQVAITTWPDALSGGLEGKTSEKVPTVLRYIDGETQWGFQFVSTAPHHKWFKLDLDPQQRYKLHGVASTLMESHVPRNEEDVPVEKKATDYLTALRKHVEEVLRYKISATALSKTPIQYVLTVPAVWSEGAQAKTRACAEKAGMGHGAALELISEPEAAALFALKTMRHAGWKLMDTFTVIDAGGGTVDLISYKIMQLTPVIKVAEASVGTGGLCGSTFIDRLFQKKLIADLGSETGWDAEVLDEATQYFQRELKPSFSGGSKNGHDFKIPVPGMAYNEAKGIRRGKYTMTVEDITAIFEPVVQDIIGLVLGQIRALKGSASKMLMVGGLGQSSYLRERIREAVPDVEVLQPGNGWSAVARGALIRGIELLMSGSASVSVGGRMARKHYGRRIWAKFDPALHEKHRKSWDASEGLWRVITLDWFLKKGDMVEEHKPIDMPEYVNHKQEFGRPSILHTCIQVCNDPENIGAPLYENGEVQQLVEVTADLSWVPIHKFPIFTGHDGKLYYTIQYSIQVTYFSGYTRYELVHGGINYGAVRAEYV